MAVGFSALALALGLGLQGASGRAKEVNALAPLFQRARTDPTAIVPLILAASEELRAVDPAKARLLGDTLEPFCRRAFFGPELLPGMEKLGLRSHVVREGEVPERIARPYRIGAGLLGYLNESFEPRRLRVGQKLKVLDLSGDRLEIVVDRDAYRVAAWRRLDAGEGGDGGRALVLYAAVGLGAEKSPTPGGKTSISLRARDPEWTDPVTKVVYKPGDPRNILGGYWIALDGAGLGKNGIGFHGFTGDVPENWIEQPASQGCIRMLQADIDRLFHLAVEGTSVEIEP